MSTPTPKPTTDNPFYILSEMEDDDETVITSNQSNKTANDDVTTSTISTMADSGMEEIPKTNIADTKIHNTPILQCHMKLPTKQ